MADSAEIVKTNKERMFDLMKRKPPGYEQELLMLEGINNDILNETPEPFVPGVNPRNIGIAALNQIPKSAAKVAQMPIDLANFVTRGELRNDQGFLVRDDMGRPQQKPPLFDIDLNKMASDTSSRTANDILDSPRAANAIEFGMDGLMFGPPGGTAISGSARLLAKLPTLSKFVNPFKQLTPIRDSAGGMGAGVMGGAFSDTPGESNLLAEIAGPMAVTSTIKGAPTLLKKLFPSYENDLGQMSEEIATTILKQLSEDTGYTVKDLQEMYETLGPDGLLADVDDNFRIIVREAKAQGVLGGKNTRQIRTRVDGEKLDAPENAGSYGRVRTEVDSKLGAIDGNSYINDLQEATQDDINRLYDNARNTDFPKRDATGFVTTDVLPDQLQEILDLPSDAMQSAVASAKAAQLNRTGSEVFDNSFDYINAVKQGLDDQIASTIGAASGNQQNLGRSIIALKKRFIDIADNTYPGYKEARNLFAGVESLKDAVEVGRNFLKMNINELESLKSTMGASELSAFKIGARDEILDQISRTPIGSNMGKKLTRTNDVVTRIGVVMEGTELRNFLDTMQREGEFIRTRNFVLGGTQSFDKFASSGNMRSGVAGLMNAASTPLGQIQLFSQLAENLSKNKGEEAYRRGLAMASDVLLNSDLSSQEVFNLLNSGQIRRLIEPLALTIWGKENVPKEMIKAIRGMTIIEASKFLANERDAAESQNERDTREKAALDSPALNRMAARTGF